MPVIEDDLWKNPGHPGMIIVTTNATVQEDGRLVMSQGAAREAVNRIPGIELQCGAKVCEYANDGVYGFLPVRPSRPQEKRIGFGIFQTRREWDGRSDPEIIQYSMERLRSYIQQQSSLKVRMNYPGIGEHGLPVEHVAPLLEPLPPNLVLCHHGEVPPQMPPGLSGVKDLYRLIERWLMEGHYEEAVRYLMDNGYAQLDAEDQVNAVRRQMKEKTERAAEQRQWRQHIFN